MLDEYNALIKNNTWILVPRPSDANIVRSLWLFQHKSNADGTLNRYKARLVVNGNTQLTATERAGKCHCNPCRTPVDTDSKLSADADPVSDPTLYRSLTRALQYLTFTRLDISYVVQQVCLYMHDPREPYFSALKRILRYIRGTMPYGLQLFSSTTSLVAYSDADWAGCPTTRRSTSGLLCFLGTILLSLVCKRGKLPFLAPVAEAEYRVVSYAY
ncbi:ribonuclease H-like domain-containing protein [Tanacetum coccineum]|uniref:Ribonuclease H-like domain-containing protein n=1 Tax=Tanacetum coccineum TaxID=301880 RepID=A0ABQ4XQ69_9ASTR